MDAGNMLKPMLARGELHCIGATTLDEYRRHIEKDAALERRFQPVIVDEPTRRGHDLDPARAARALRGAPRRSHPGRRAGRGGHARAPLHHRPLPARQGDRPGRRGVRGDPHRDRLDAAGARRDHPPRDAAGDRGGRAQEGEGQGQQGAAGGAAQGARRPARPGRRDDAPSGRPSARRSTSCRRCARSSSRCAARSRRPSAATTSTARPSCATAGCPSSSAGCAPRRSA